VADFIGNPVGIWATDYKDSHRFFIKVLITKLRLLNIYGVEITTFFFYLSFENTKSKIAGMLLKKGL